MCLLDHVRVRAREGGQGCSTIVIYLLTGVAYGKYYSRTCDEPTRGVNLPRLLVNLCGFPVVNDEVLPFSAIVLNNGMLFPLAML